MVFPFFFAAISYCRQAVLRYVRISAGQFPEVCAQTVAESGAAAFLFCLFQPASARSPN
jgi:hypothetical protein